MVPVSIVIITRNEAEIRPLSIAKAKLITDDIVVIANSAANIPSNIYLDRCYVYKRKWDGYGANKNKGIETARYNWILSIDSDEVPDDELIQSLHQLNYNDPSIVYDIKFRSYFGEKLIRFGSWGRDHHIRLFHRSVVKWSETVVHETLILPTNTHVKKLDGHLHHYSVKNLKEYENKSSYYAKLSAKKYFKAGKRTTAIKLYLSPIFGFIKNYIFYLGFMDGREGWDIAKTTLISTRCKYHLLRQMQSLQQKKRAYKDNFAVEYSCAE